MIFLNGRESGDVDQQGMAGHPGCVTGGVIRLAVTGDRKRRLLSDQWPCAELGVGGEEVTEVGSVSSGRLL